MKKKMTSNASRNVTFISSYWFNKARFKKLNFRFKNKSGRGSTGRVILWTKQKTNTSARSIVINYNFRTTIPVFMSTFTLTPFSNKLLTLAMLPGGGVTYLPTTYKTKIFNFWNFFVREKEWWRIKDELIACYVALIPMFQKISNVEAVPGLGIQYVRSSGSFGKITSKNETTNSAILKLPSGVRKIVSTFSVIMLGSVSLKNKNLVKSTKSGYWRNNGRKPIVRGVAMNPVDHPHGGRTKSIKYPRTPWGKTTKFK